MEILSGFGRSKSGGEIRSTVKELALSSIIADAYGAGTVAITRIAYSPLRLASPGVGR